MRLQKIVELIKYDACAHTHAAFFKIEICDLPVVARELDDQAFANRVSNETRAGAARRDRNARIGRRANHQAGLLRGFRKRHADRFDLVNRRVGRIKLARQITKARVASGLPDLPLLRGSHRSSPTYYLHAD